MSRGVKIALVIVGVVFVLAATCVGGAWYWWEQNGESIKAAANEAGEAGVAFGAEASNADACIEEGLQRSSRCGQMEIACVTGSQLFTQACLRAAPADPTLCEGVPGPGEIIDSVEWTTQQCSARGQAGNQFCQNVFSALQTHCGTN